MTHVNHPVTAGNPDTTDVAGISADPMATDQAMHTGGRGYGTSSSPTILGKSARVRAVLSFRRISAVYILIALMILFGLWVPDTFLTESTFRTLLDGRRSPP